jgi:DNA-binding MarR family transcriptional regulator
VHDRGERVLVEGRGGGEEVVQYHETMVTQPGLYDKDLVLWTLLLAESLNAQVLGALRERGHPELRYSHGFLFQRLVEGPRAVGELAADLGVTSQAVSKAVRELEALGYVRREPDPADARIRRVGLSERGVDAVEAGREIRAELNARFAGALGAGRVEAAAGTLADAVRESGALDAVRTRRVRPTQGLGGEGR